MKKRFLLIIAMLMAFTICLKADEGKEAVSTYQAFILDGEKVEIAGYLIEGNNYFKLRDMAAILSNTDRKFNVEYEKGQIKIKTNESYKKLPTDLQGAKDEKLRASMVTNKVLFDNGVAEKLVDLDAALIKQNNYVKLRDLGKYIGFEVGYDKKTQDIIVNTKSDKNKKEEMTEKKADDKTEQIKSLKVLAMNGPTAMSLAPLKDVLGENLIISASIQEQIAALKKNQGDIYIIPSNLYAKLRNSGENIKALSSNAGLVVDLLGMNELKSVEELKGKTLAIMGRGAIPEIILRKLLEVNGLTIKDINLIYLGSPEEAAPILKKNKEAYVLVPQPFATVLPAKIKGLKSALDIDKEWKDKKLPEIITALVVVKEPVYKEKQDAVDAFVKAYKDGVDKLLAGPKDYSKTIEEIMGLKAPIAEKALGKIKYIDLQGKDLTKALDDFFSILLENNAELIGGKLPIHE